MTKIVKSQLQITVEGLKRKPLTMLMLSHLTGIERANICRYIARLQRSNIVKLVKKAKCEITDFTAGYYTSDENQFPSRKQLNLFK